jgi:hypothetical protein
MTLNSKLFRSDPKLEAAAVSDPGLILPGSTGPHVTKIQSALNLLDHANIDCLERQTSLETDEVADLAP